MKILIDNELILKALMSNVFLYYRLLNNLTLLFLINNRSFLFNPIRYMVVTEITIDNTMISNTDIVEVLK